MANIAKKFRNLNVLIHFYEEKRFSILKLKDCLPKDCEEFSSEKFKIQDQWNRERRMEVEWNGSSYPAYFLQFGGKFFLSYT